MEKILNKVKCFFLMAMVCCLSYASNDKAIVIDALAVVFNQDVFTFSEIADYGYAKAMVDAKQSLQCNIPTDIVSIDFLKSTEGKIAKDIFLQSQIIEWYLNKTKLSVDISKQKNKIQDVFNAAWVQCGLENQALGQLRKKRIQNVYQQWFKRQAFIENILKQRLRKNQDYVKKYLETQQLMTKQDMQGKTSQELFKTYQDHALKQLYKKWLNEQVAKQTIEWKLR